MKYQKENQWNCIKVGHTTTLKRKTKLRLYVEGRLHGRKVKGRRHYSPSVQHSNPHSKWYSQ